MSSSAVAFRCLALYWLMRHVFLSPVAGPEQRCGPSRRRCHHPHPPQTAGGWPSTLWSKNNHQGSQYFSHTRFQSNVGTDWAGKVQISTPFFGRNVTQSAPGPPWSACRGWCSRWARAALSSPCSWTCCCPAVCGQTQRYWTPDSQSPAPHLREKKKEKTCLRTRSRLIHTARDDSELCIAARGQQRILTVRVYGIVHVLCVVDLCSHIGDHKVKGCTIHLFTPCKMSQEKPEAFQVIIICFANRNAPDNLAKIQVHELPFLCCDAIAITQRKNTTKYWVVSISIHPSSESIAFPDIYSQMMGSVSQEPGQPTATVVWKDIKRRSPWACSTRWAGSAAWTTPWA